MISVENFLLAFGKEKLLWDMTDANEIAIRLCEEGYYKPSEKYPEQGDREFLMIALGWMCGNSGDYVLANCSTILVLRKMNEVYEVVAKKNSWY